MCFQSNRNIQSSYFNPKIFNVFKSSQCMEKLVKRNMKLCFGSLFWRLYRFIFFFTYSIGNKMRVLKDGSVNSS